MADRDVGATEPLDEGHVQRAPRHRAIRLDERELLRAVANRAGARHDLAPPAIALSGSWPLVPFVPLPLPLPSMGRSLENFSPCSATSLHASSWSFAFATI